MFLNFTKSANSRSVKPLLQGKLFTFSKHIMALWPFYENALNNMVTLPKYKNAASKAPIYEILEL